MLFKYEYEHKEYKLKNSMILIEVINFQKINLFYNFFKNNSNI